MIEKHQSGWLSNRTIHTKLLLAFGSILLAFLLAVSAILIALVKQTESRQWTQHTRDVIDQLDGTVRALQKADLDLRDLVMSGDARTAERFSKDAGQVRQHIAATLQLSNDNVSQQARLRQLDTQLQTWIDNVASATVAAVAEAPRDGDRQSARFHEIGLRYLAETNPTMRAWLDTLDQARVEELGLLDQRTAALTRMVVIVRAIVIGMFVLGMLVGLLALRLSSRLITQPVQHLTELMTRLADGDHGIEVAGQGRADEIGAIARSLDVFKQSSIATAEQSWIKANVAEIAGLLQAAETPDEFAHALTAEVAPRLKAGVALFFAWGEADRHLDLRGSYGFKQRKHLCTRYAPGEGLVGQVALERKTIVLEPVPDDYIRIHSGLGEAPPRSIIALPLLQKDQLLGVLEFGSFLPFGSKEQNLLDELLPFAALALENLSRARRTQELLEHTQRQAMELQTSEEELRVQQEELSATNEELQAKTVELEEQQQRLKSSEEELRVQAEELQASNEELRQTSDTLAEQKRMLEQAQLETEQKATQLARASQYKSDFLANMSHELRTPLNSLLILSRNLADNDGGNLDDEQVESARVIHESGSNLLRLINDILDLSKIEAGKMQVVAEEFPLSHFVQALLRRFRPVASEKSLAFEVSVAEGLSGTSLLTDGTRLEQIANNLVGNAFKFTREGSVHVDIARPRAELAASLGLATDHAIAISVIDTGIGIPNDRIEHVFGTFEQMDASTSRKYGGSGLGLAISRRLCELLGGGIDVKSVVNEGSRFTVILPERMPGAVAGEPLPTIDAADGAPPLPELPPNPPPALVSMPKPWIPDDRDALEDGDTVILAIEDDPVFARTLVDMIRRNGHRALAAGDGESGLYLARHFRPTGILLDVMLPGIDGWDVIERLKADPVTRRIPVHFISGVEESARAQRAGAVGFLTKPAERDALLDAFERLLRSAPGGPRRMLLVDDDADSRRAVASIISTDSVEILEAGSAEEALPLLEQSTFDVVVLDLGLPGMSGFELLDRMEARGGEMPPIVIHSGRELTRDESARLRQFTDSIIIKGTRSLERLLDEVSLFLHSVRKSTAPRIVRDLDSSLTGRTVLVVDDDMRNIFALSKILREKGLNVVMAQDGQKALRQLDENKSIEIVLMDIMMPGMDGYETMREARKRPALAKLPIIAVTAKAMTGDRDKCLEAGASDYLAKPIDIDKLLSMMRIWLHA